MSFCDDLEIGCDYINTNASSEKTVNNSDELFIKAEVRNPVLKELLDRLESKYGCLLTNVGCVTNDNWLSVKAVAMMVSELDKDVSTNIFAAGVTCEDCDHFEPCFSGGPPLWKNIKQIEEDHCRHFKPKITNKP
ncbi:MAG: hypothetical protein UGF89_06590 [Acutalibacteraceae bacterium]|nr:hypothetical protein [Acutalibacteraceae bacterium]